MIMIKNKFICQVPFLLNNYFLKLECESIHDGILTYGIQTGTVTYIETYRASLVIF